MKNIVLVHGGFVDGAGWEGVYQILKKQGYNVSVVQNPTISLQDDVKVTKRILDAQDGPAILVGHSYGGAVITEAGTHPKVAGLVYITAFAPDKGESVGSLIKDPPPGRTGTPDSASAGWIFVPGQQEVSGLFCRGRRSGKSRIHGRLPGALGIGGSQWLHQRTSVEDEAKLVFGGH
jgi:pimeloyl-ACP methyl ester carboxylesterase